MRANRKKGFTMVELLIVIALMAIIAAVAVPVVVGQVEKAQTKGDKTMFEALKTDTLAAINTISGRNVPIDMPQVLEEIYYTHNGDYNDGDKYASSLGDFPYYILPYKMSQAYPTDKKFVTVALIIITKEGNYDHSAFELCMYDPTKPAGAKLLYSFRSEAKSMFLDMSDPHIPQVDINSTTPIEYQSIDGGQTNP